MKKKALLSSILTIALCLSLIAGSTFALFTSESKVNVAVTAGKVDVKATIEDISLHSPKSISANGNVIDDTEAASDNTFKNGGTAQLDGNTLTLDRVTPGDSVTATIKLTNNSNVSIQYRTVIKGGEGDNALLNGLKVTFGEGESAQSFTGNTIKSAWTAFDGETKTIQVKIELPATAGNEYQEKSCNLTFTVEAVQGNAQMPDDEWDGSSVEAPEQDETGVYHITNAAEFMALMNSFNDGVVNTWRGEYAESQIVLDCNIDLGGATIERGIPSFFYGKFDGQGHVISNFTLKRVQGANDPDGSGFTGYYTSLFGSLNGTGYVKNLTIENATVIGNKSVSAIVGTIWGGTVDNCHVINSTLIGIDQVGAVVGYNGANGTVSNCSATDCNIFYSRTSGLNEDIDSEIVTRGVIGDNDGTATGCTASNTAPEFKAVDYVLTNAAEFQAYITELNNNPQFGTYRYDGANVVLTNDIDLGGAVITASDEGYMFNGSFDGLGHTVSNYTIKRTDGEYYTGLFSVYMGEGGEIKNLTVKNGTVISNGKQVAAIVPSLNGGENGGSLVDNCHAINCTVVGVKKVGAVAGYAETGATVKNCSAQGCTVYASNDNDVDASLFGYDNGGTFTNNEDKGGNTVETGVTGTFVTSAADLATALTVDGANVVLLNDITVTESWTPVAVSRPSAYVFAQSISIDGNGHSISGLNAPLLAGNTAKDITIKNLTIKNSEIESGNENGLGQGAFIAYRDNSNAGTITMENCHLVNSTVTANAGAGALIGYVGQNDVSIKDCSAINCTISGSDVGGLIGFCMTDSAKTDAIEGCTVSGCTLNGSHVGQIAGTVNSNGTLTIDDCTFSGVAVPADRVYATVIVDGTTLPINS